MFIDYGKRAYAKLIEFEKRLESVEKQLKSVEHNVLNFNLALLQTANVQERTVKFTSNKNGTSHVKLNVALSENVLVNLEIKVNGTLLFKTQIDNQTLVYENDVTLNSGENVVLLYFNSGLPFTLNTCSFSVEGSVEYLNVFRKISVLSTDNQDYITYLSGTDATFYVYNGELNDRYQINSVVDCSLLGVIENEYFLLAILADGTMQLRRLNVNNHVGIYYPVNVKGATSVSGYVLNNSLVIYFVKSNELYRGVYELNGNFTYNKTGIKANRVYADSSGQGAFIVTGAYGARLYLEEIEKGYQINNAQNFHLYKTSNGYEITFFQNGVQKLRNASENGLETETQIGFSHELVKLKNGKISRERDTLSISEE
ncbi:MAG: hypothetical protein IKL82_05720 [Clostridia bacterium]|nr:hypothetical protein [Clostridia bacterium]